MSTSKLDKEDFYIDDLGRFVFTEKYHLKRGFCCENRCKHCPYGNMPSDKTKGKS
ncbi:MAG: hypothetical protein ACJAZ3_000199 [Sphingobacteriales bacterium]|jgi:hypothetical protein